MMEKVWLELSDRRTDDPKSKLEDYLLARDHPLGVVTFEPCWMCASEWVDGILLLSESLRFYCWRLHEYFTNVARLYRSRCFQWLTTSPIEIKCTRAMETWIERATDQLRSKDNSRLPGRDFHPQRSGKEWFVIYRAALGQQTNLFDFTLFIVRSDRDRNSNEKIYKKNMCESVITDHLNNKKKEEAEVSTDNWPDTILFINRTSNIHNWFERRSSGDVSLIRNECENTRFNWFFFLYK